MCSCSIDIRNHRNRRRRLYALFRENSHPIADHSCKKLPVECYCPKIDECICLATYFEVRRLLEQYNALKVCVLALSMHLASWSESKAVLRGNLEAKDSVSYILQGQELYWGLKAVVLYSTAFVESCLRPFLNVHEVCKCIWWCQQLSTIIVPVNLFQKVMASSTSGVSWGCNGPSAS